MTEGRNTARGQEHSTRIAGLETELELAKDEWAAAADEHSRVQTAHRPRWRWDRTRKARQAAAKLERALADYGAAWRRLEDARRGSSPDGDPAPPRDPATATFDPEPSEATPQEDSADPAPEEESLEAAPQDERDEAKVSPSEATPQEDSADPAPEEESLEAAPQDERDEAKVSLNTADYHQLRAAGMSVTQTGRVLRYREEHGRFTSVDELDGLPGFPDTHLAAIKERVIP